VAAPTTSLPENVGGGRNRDYRFCWVRDACVCYYALKKFGSTPEAQRFFSLLIDISETQAVGTLKPLYGIDGYVELSERTIDHYEGYRGSRPVRVGNEAAEQHQVDVSGQILDLMHLYHSFGGVLDERLRKIGTTMTNSVAAHWREPDSGLWEPRLAPKRYVHAAIMNWVALDRAIRLFGPRPEWVRERDAIVTAVRQEGVHANGYLTQTFGGETVDAAVLIAPMVDFPIDEKIIDRTVDAVIDRLGQDPLVHRYTGDDGLPGHEGAFVQCAFWLIDALVWLGRFDEAKARFIDLSSLANDVGLFPEEIAEDGTFLGNFPQVCAHLGLIHSALVLDLYAGGGKEAARGTYADRILRETLNQRPTSIAEMSEDKGIQA
jgi:GH15 family glucan-1,4-alpha-glucosidase